MTQMDRVAEARRFDLTENEQLALATFADDPAVAEALLSRPDLGDAAEAVARATRRQSLPWWRRMLGSP